MDWIVPVSADERAQSLLRPQTERAAQEALETHGCVLLRGAFDAALIDGLYRDFMARYGALDARRMKALADRPPPNPLLEVGGARFEITVPMTGAFADPRLFANLLLLRFLAKHLGDDMRLSGFTAVVSHPGATQQHTHRDHPPLFPHGAAELPTYAINVSVPLIDVDAETGPTGIWPGSQRWPAGTAAPLPQTAILCPVQRGDCILMDYRTLHAGLANRSARVRPILYMVYARTWFFDEVNHVGRTPLDMPLDAIEALPEYTRPLMTRAYAQAMRARWHETR
ncbi:MAG TPA: phytanoyl-CoA dioxygenase family protein [Rhizomicrobium sp.]|jgi:hypothetical protein|nr:phytanoyl-CoA dioxygenase family protein [Rhizomicrobium sp.]